MQLQCCVKLVVLRFLHLLVLCWFYEAVCIPLIMANNNIVFITFIIYPTTFSLRINYSLQHSLILICGIQWFVTGQRNHCVLRTLLLQIHWSVKPMVVCSVSVRTANAMILTTWSSWMSWLRMCCCSQVSCIWGSLAKHTHAHKKWLNVKNVNTFNGIDNKPNKKQHDEFSFLRINVGTFRKPAKPIRL